MLIQGCALRLWDAPCGWESLHPGCRWSSASEAVPEAELVWQHGAWAGLPEEADRRAFSLKKYFWLTLQKEKLNIS